jgi:hypothetical protein
MLVGKSTVQYLIQWDINEQMDFNSGNHYSNVVR